VSSDFIDWSAFHRLQNDLAALQSTVTQLAHERRELTTRIATLEDTVGALVEILGDAKQLDRQEVAARVEAAVIARRHAEREATAHSADAWDALKPR
jgi:hypothetical protein